MDEVTFPIMGKGEVEKWIPHKKDMTLIDGILSLDGETMRSHATLDSSSPMFSCGKTPTYVSFELVAQSVSAYSHILDHAHRGKPSIGFILKVTNFVFNEPYFEENAEALVTIKMEAMLPDGIFSFSGKVECEGRLVASGSLLLIDANDGNIIKRMVEGDE